MRKRHFMLGLPIASLLATAAVVMSMMGSTATTGAMLSKSFGKAEEACANYGNPDPGPNHVDIKVVNLAGEVQIKHNFEFVSFRGCPTTTAGSDGILWCSAIINIGNGDANRVCRASKPNSNTGDSYGTQVADDYIWNKTNLTG